MCKRNRTTFKQRQQSRQDSTDSPDQRTCQMGRSSLSLYEDFMVFRMQGYLMCMSHVGSQFASIHTLTPRFRPDLPIARIEFSILFFLLWRKCEQVSYQGTLRIHDIRVFSLPSSPPCLLQMDANDLPASSSNWPRVLLLRRCVL
jgi:hypothetical protein